MCTVCGFPLYVWSFIALITPMSGVVILPAVFWATLGIPAALVVLIARRVEASANAVSAVVVTSGVSLALLMGAMALGR
jgi:hypothetical protein